jgi:hypothetical protein
VTVCVAALCDNGQRAVVATDGAITLGGIQGDILVPGKMVWFSDWLFLWAGEPGNIDLVLENMRQIARVKKEAFSRPDIQSVIKKAFRKFVSDWTADYVLSAYDMDMSEFKKEGRTIFGDEVVKDITKRMDEAVSNYLTDELLVLGWGKSRFSAMLYQRSASLGASHALTGSAAIGSGSQAALSTLILLGQSRYTSLEETIYNIASAKFMAEKSERDGVGKTTGMFITHKRTSKDPPDQPVGHWIETSDIKRLRALWEQHGRPKTPMEAMFPIEEILKNSGLEDFHLSTGTKMKIMAAGIKVPGGGMSF